MKRSNLKYFYIFIILFSSSCYILSQEKTISIKNEFILIEVNNEKFDKGRFSIDTVKGDPTRDADDNKILIYGHPKPWTSFTTIRIDGENYIFGGETKKRAGKTGKFGKLILQSYIPEEHAIITTIEFDKIIVTQKLNIVQGPSSKMFDTVKISYTVENTDNVQHNIGIRIVLDTMLGTNDGAPFRVGDKNIIDEKQLMGVDIPEFWITFDNLENPGVIARGTLKGEDISSPDRIIFSNWGKLADNIWDVPYQEGQLFLREGEDEFDTAVALYWDEKYIQPNQREIYTTLYGLEYLNIIGDILKLGVPVSLGDVSTAKNQIKPLTIVAYLLNVSGFELKQLRVKILLPDELSLFADTPAEKSIGDLQSNKEIAVAWQVIPKIGGEGVKDIIVNASALDIEPVENKTKINLVSPPGISYEITSPQKIQVEKDGSYYPNPFKVDIKVKNQGKFPIDNLSCNLLLSEGLEFPEVVQPTQTLLRLEGEDEFTFSYKIIVTGKISGEIKYTVSISSDTIETKTETLSVFVPPVAPRLEFSYHTPIKKESFFPVDITLFSFKEFRSGKFIIKFDPKLLYLVFVSQGTIFVDKEKSSIWNEPVIDNEKGLIIFPQQVLEKDFSGWGIFATLNFKAKEKGSAKLTFSDTLFTDSKGNKIYPEIVDSEIVIIE